MTHIKSRKHPVRRAHAHLATTALGASLALALPMMAHAATALSPCRAIAAVT